MEKDCRLQGQDQEALAVDQRRDDGDLGWVEVMEMEKIDLRLLRNSAESFQRCGE